MGNPSGKLMIIQRPDLINVGQYINLCGFDSTTFTITNAVNDEERINCTDRALAVETIREYGAQSMSFEGSGIFDSDANGKWATDKMLAQSKEQLRVFVPEHGFFACSGGWLIPTCGFSGGTTGSLQANVSFQSSGAIAYTAI